MTFKELASNRFSCRKYIDELERKEINEIMEEI